ncbi:MAG TPA: glycosyltransferase, partial [Blastocatellia bacterium]|nr:glycosyltransferase [Blastocatellia bacterium]
DRKILIYHNITPPEYFEDDPFIAGYARKGREQLRALRDLVEFAFADSEFNRAELKRTGFRYTGVLPVTFALEELKSVTPNLALERSLNGSTNFLFVGRMAPNKKQDELISTFAYYHRNIDAKSRLILVGSASGSGEFYRLVSDLVREEGIAGAVKFTGRVSDGDLVSYYRTASAYVSMSEHEGFGVPLIESMLFDVPVVAFKASAVPLTLGGAGLLFTRKDKPLIAELLHLISRDPVLREKILTRQRQRLGELSPKRFVPELLAVIRGPSNGAHVRAAAEPKRIQIQGPFESSYSLAVINRNLARALSVRSDLDVTLYATEGPGDYVPREHDLREMPEIRALWKRSYGSPPADYVIRNMYPPRVWDVNPNQLNFLYFFWEDSLIPYEWADDFNRHLDGIMVPSKHVLDALRHSGVAIPARVVHAGVEESYEGNGPAGKPLSEMVTRKSCRFLHVSSGFPRKGCDLLIRAYSSEFSANDDVCLIVKTFPNVHNAVAGQIEAARRAKRDCPEIVHIDRDIGGLDLKGLYQSATCLVHPARAEGFGLPVAEAMLAGRPVIVTNYSGLTEFCNEKTALLLDYKLGTSGSHFNVSDAQWAEPDEAQLRAYMRAIYRRDTSLDLSGKTAAARHNIKKNFNWDVTAARSFEFMRDVEALGTRKLRAGMVTTWNVRCGIAEYSKHLLEAMTDPAIEWTVLAQEARARVAPDSEAVVRCWNDTIQNDLGPLLAEIRRRNLDAVHFQFNFSFFELTQFAKILDCLKQDGRRVLITFHSTRDAVHDGKTISLATIAGQIQSVDEVFVHSEEDRVRLAGWDIRSNVAMFPHCFPLSPNADKEEIRRTLGLSGRPVISTFGFLLPHKGLLEAIEAIKLLERRYPRIMLLAVSALYPDPLSNAYFVECKEKIRELGLGRSCKLITEFLSATEVNMALQASDMVVLPYHATNESSSAAVRLPLASHRPVITSRQPVFDDVADEVYQIDEPSPQALARGIARLTEDPDLAKQFIEKGEKRVARDSWENGARMYERIVKGLGL